jgi:hypothetical protein
MTAWVERTRTFPILLLLGGLMMACGWPATSQADPAASERFEAATRELDDPAPAPRAWWWRDGASRLQQLLRNAKSQRARTNDPEWLRYREGRELAEARLSAHQGDLCLVLQENRADGMDLLTARYTLHDAGRLRTYAGAGMNRAEYYHSDPDEPGPVRLSKRNRSTSMGATAELGAEFEYSRSVRLGADLRWADLDGRAVALRGELGPVTADRVLFEVSVGYRFR